MSYCPKCGAETGEDTKFCPKCGTEIQATGVVYRRASPGSGVGRVFALIIGGFILLVAFGLVAGGCSHLEPERHHRQPGLHGD